MELNFSVAISGYYGYHNLGDQLILKHLLTGFQKHFPGIKLNVFVKTPYNEKKTAFKKINFINRYNPWAIFKNLLTSRILIMGGGSIIQDITGFFTIYYYILLMIVAKCLDCKVVIFNQGIGPVKNPVNRYLVKLVFSLTDLIIVRDNRSKKLLNALLPDKEIILGADLIFFHQLSRKNKANRNICSFSVRKWKSHNIKKFVKQAAAVLDKRGWKCFNIVFQPGSDEIINCKFLKNIYWNKPDDITRYLKKSDFLVGMRLHSLMLGAKLNIPMLGIVYDPKVNVFCKYMSIPRVRVDTLKTEDIVKSVLNYTNSHPDYTDKIKILKSRLDLSWRKLENFMRTVSLES